MLTHPIDSATHRQDDPADPAVEPSRAAADIARHIVALPHLVVIDTTTTGPRGELLEFAAVDRAGAILFHTLIRPQSPIPARATALHGITNEDVVDAPHLAQVWTSITTVLRNRPVAGYQIIVSQRHLRRCAEHLAVPFRDSRWLSIDDLYSQYTQRTRSCSLETACQEQGIAPRPQQRAAATALAGLALLTAMADSSLT